MKSAPEGSHNAPTNLRCRHAWSARGAASLTSTLNETSSIATMNYDGLGRRIGKAVTGSRDWDATYHHYYDGHRMIETRNGSADVLKRHVWARPIVGRRGQATSFTAAAHGAQEMPKSSPTFPSVCEHGVLAQTPKHLAWRFLLVCALLSSIALVISCDDRPTKPARDRSTRPARSRVVEGVKVAASDWHASPEQLAAARRLGVPVRESIPLKGGVEIGLILIPAGEGQMGVPYEEGCWYSGKIVVRRAFYLGQTEVTQKQYHAVMDDNPSIHKGPRLPVDGITWLQAKSFCGRAAKETNRSFRLPTDPEWEYACRAGTVTAYNTGAVLTSGQANFRQEDGDTKGDEETPQGGPRAVGTYRPNAWGLHDMHGNVMEWCILPHPTAFVSRSGPAVVPQCERPGDTKALRGGAWWSDGRSCKSTRRLQPPVSIKWNGREVRWRKGVGFRVVVDISK